MKVLVVGATGGSGRAAVAAALEAGHDVTAFSRHASALGGTHARLRTVDGDALDAAAMGAVVTGQEAVIVTLGISESALAVRLRGSKGTSMHVRSRGTANIIEAMRESGVRRLVVQSTYGVGNTRGRLPLVERLVFALLLKPQIADTERQEAEVRASSLDWTLVQPVNLTNEDIDDLPFASVTGETRGMKVARSSVGRFLVRAIEDPSLVGCSVALSSTVREASRVVVS